MDGEFFITMIAAKKLIHNMHLFIPILIRPKVVVKM